MGVIFLVSALSTLPQAGEGALDVVIKKLGHVTEYAILGWLWWRALSNPKAVTTRPRFWALIISVAYAITDEFHQSLVPLRHPKVSDVLIDTVGIALALLFIWGRERLHDSVD
jgi:VanZ family protein